VLNCVNGDRVVQIDNPRPLVVATSDARGHPVSRGRGSLARPGWYGNDPCRNSQPGSQAGQGLNPLLQHLQRIRPVQETEWPNDS